MKTRTALIYVAVLVLLGGYFYYFEIVRHKTRAEQEEAALRLFPITEAAITSVQLDKEGSLPVSIRKNGQWHIVEPINTPADEFAVESLLTTLTSLKMEREVKNSADALQPYGLKRPQLQISFLADDSRHHLRIGAKAAVGNQHYASGDQENRVLLISASQQQSLNKSLFDLRSKEFFTFTTDEVRAITIERTEGTLIIEKVNNERWQSKAEPDVKIKSSKVDSLLNRLLWLRAKRFLSKEAGSASHVGLAPARIRVNLSTKEQTETLLLGDKTEDQSIYATGDGLTGIALVEDKLLKKLPASLTDLEDRSLLSSDVDQVEDLQLQLNGETYRLERQGEEWNWPADQTRDDPENWRVNSLLWRLQDLEYLPGEPPEGLTPPRDPQLRVELLSGDGSLGTFVLRELPGEKGGRMVVWFSRGRGTAQPYWLSSESVHELYEDAITLLNPESQETKD